MSALQKEQITKAVQLLQNGEVVAYPTEAVFGLGCDPFNEQAMQKLLHVKQRPLEKGVILIASKIEQIMDLVELENQPWQQQVEDSWPGPVTWVLPVKKALPNWITGGRESLAVRVSSHPTVCTLCDVFAGAVVSTSANLSGQEPAKSCQQIQQIFQDQVYCLDGSLGQLSQPTQIWDAVSLKQIR